MIELHRKPAGHRGVFWSFVLLTLASAALALVFKARADAVGAELVAQSRAAAITAVTENVRLVGESIAGLTAAADLARELSNGGISFELIEKRLEDGLRYGNGMSMTVAWFPDFKPPALESADNSVIYFKSAVVNNQALRQLDGHYVKAQEDFTDHGDISVWYRLAKEAGAPVWISSPYRSPVSNTWWASGYSVPFYKEGSMAGVVAAELTLEQASRLILKSETESFSDFPLEASFGMLLNEHGTIISHPDHDVVRNRMNISDFFPKIGVPGEIPVAEGIREVDSGSDDFRIFELPGFRDTKTGQLLSVFFAPIKGTHWWTAVVLDHDSIDRSMGHPETNGAGQFRIMLSTLAFSIFLVLLLCRVDRGTRGMLWPAAIISTLICMAGIAWILTHSFNHDFYYHPGEVILKNRAIPAKALLNYQGDRDQTTASVPTGIFVQSAEFSSANDVTITGFIWQIYNDDMPGWLRRGPEDTDPGFIFPESEQTNVKFRYRRKAGNGWTYGWYFNAVLRQEFDYSRYPFDLENVWIRIWHSDLGHDVALVPDLESYTTLIPDQFPGRELQDFVLEGWDPAGTYFSYRNNSYNTNFGIREYQGSQAFPELYFNITLTRSFLNAFIMNFITLTVAAFLLYALLHTIRSRDKKQGLLGFNVSGVLAFCAALFFVVIVAHTSLRESLAAPRLVYLEYYFFVMYAAFIGVSVNAITVASFNPHPWVRIGDNLVARLLFWPLLSLALLIATLVIFY